MKLTALTRLEQNARRAGEIIRVLAKYGFADWLPSQHYAWIRDRLRGECGEPVRNLELEARVRLACTELGPTFIKLGQLLSMRPDLVGPKLARELAHLLTATPADPTDTVRATIASELGKPPEELFAVFEAEPMASASIGQVHRAQLLTGEYVAVKVQHAGIVSTITTDLDILDSLAELAERHLPQVRRHQPVMTMRQFRRTLLQECDFTVERRNLEQFAANFADDATVHFPHVFPALSTRRVLTMERLEGILGTDSAALAASGVDLNALARQVVNMYLQMLLRDGFYHADPHPGNLMLLQTGAVGVLDCGMVGRLDEVMTEGVEDIVLALANRSSVDLTAVVLRLGSFPATVSREQLHADIADLMVDYVDRPIQELDTSGALNRFLEIIRSYNIALPPPLLLVVRTLIELDGAGQALSPQFSLAEVVQSYSGDIVLRRFSPPRLLARAQRATANWGRVLEALPRDLNDVMERMREGSFAVRIEHHRVDVIANRLVLGLVTAALLVSSALLWSAKAPPLVGGTPVLGVAGYLLAGYLGWRLARTMRKSDDDSDLP